ncbi:MAG: topoisomerase subunit, partial [Verrucomicrobiales bacterium]|nr:topoisomerase subunit [Verrucomicrobiales bacterium]
MPPKRKDESKQPELPIPDASPAPPPVPNAGVNGNGETHVQAEDVSAEVVQHRPFAPGDQDLELHKRVDTNFLQYASYVIRDRAIPNIEDGLKPVQRRILWALKRMDDGRLIKVATVSGEAMKYHPHGQAAIDDALVVLANKRYLIEGQGNYGNIYTGDPAAASRYIECRLTELARKEIFNDELTEFVPSYDGRNNEPVTLPAKLPLLLMLGAEGIAVGLSCRILPHNFIELLQGQIAILKGESFRILPDFQTGGLMDAREYDDGRGSIKVRAKIKAKDENTVVITEIPPTT